MQDFPQQTSSPVHAGSRSLVPHHKTHLSIPSVSVMEMVLNNSAQASFVLKCDFWLTFPSFPLTSSAYLCINVQKITLMCFRHPTSELALIASCRREVHKLTLLCIKTYLPVRINISIIFV